MNVIALRHGESEYNILGLCNDDPRRGVDLTAIGQAQAERAAARLTGDGIDAVIASPLLRARRTAAIVAAALRLPVRVEDRLGDIRSGCEGRPVREYLDAIANDPVDARVDGGESLRDYALRVHAFLAELEQGGLDCPLLVAHEETLRMIHARYRGLPLEQVAGRAFDNCEPYRYDV